MAAAVAKPGPSSTTGNPKNTCRDRRGEETPGMGRTRGQICCGVDKVGEGRHLSPVPAAGASAGTGDSLSGLFPAALPYQRHQKTHFIFPVSPTKSVSGTHTSRQGPCQDREKAVTFPASITVVSGPGRALPRGAARAGVEESDTQGTGRFFRNRRMSV